MSLSIAALFIFIFGAYAYGYLFLLWWRTPAEGSAESRDFKDRVGRVAVVMSAACTLWFVLHAIIEFPLILGEPRENDLVDLAALELVFFFPGLIFHTYLLESMADADRPVAPGWRVVMGALYAAGVACALYFPAVIFDLLPGPDRIGPFIGISIGSLFTVMSIFCLLLMQARPPRRVTRDERRLGMAMRFLFLSVIGAFVALNVLRPYQLVIDVMNVAVRAMPLHFLLVSIYFENRIQFYDIIVKRGLLLVFSLVLTGGVFTLALGALDGLPDGPSRPWVFAVLLLPVAMLLPWLHDRVGRLLDRLWFGREFTPVEAVKHVLGAMQQATDEPSLIASTEAALSEIFRRRVAVLRDGAAPPAGRAAIVDLPASRGAAALRIAVLDDSGSRGLLSEDIALLRSLGSVFGYMLDNVRLQRKRQEQEQLAHALRLQTSRSELKALRAQINPHFLFNALNAIASLIHTDPARADAAVEQLAEVFRYTLRRSEQEWAPLDQELAFARAYLDVEQARFGKRLTYAVYADPGLGRTQVPSMLLQTLVENAVKHGISRLRTPGRIEIRAARHDGRVVLEVRDTGPGPEAHATRTPSGESFGLRSVRERLQGHFGANAALQLVRDRDLTVARITMPVVEEGAASRAATAHPVASYGLPVAENLEP